MKQYNVGVENRVIASSFLCDLWNDVTDFLVFTKCSHPCSLFWEERFKFRPTSELRYFYE